ncbi:MAG: hypothetical protein KDK89_23565 [Alphaproteobacteria bacterium]|nr:hypothetical protein [Alphaproteobacteria bacterium]
MQLQKSGDESILESAGIGAGAAEPDITVLSNGNLLVTWSEVLGQPTDEFDDVDGAVFARILDADGVAVSDIFQVNTFGSYVQDQPKVVALNSGSFAIGYTSTLVAGNGPADADTFIRFFDSTGQQTGSFFIDVNPDTASFTPNSFDQENLQDIVKLTGNRFAVILDDPITFSTNPGQAYIYDSAGSLIQILEEPVDAMVQLANGNILVAGTQLADPVGDGIWLMLMSNLFQAPTGFEGVYQPLDFFVEGGAGTIRTDSLELAALTGGGAALAYVEEFDSKPSTFNISLLSDVGAFTGASVPVAYSLRFDGKDGMFDMIGLSGGGLAVALTALDDDGQARGVDLLLFDADGTLQTRMQAGVSDLGDQAYPTLTELRDGRIALVYTDDSGDSNNMRLVHFDVTGASARFVGTAGDDNLGGVAGDDRIVGLAGNDTINGRGGDDRLLGGDGDDILKGGSGKDALRGGAGADKLDGGAGDDGLGGGEGNDRVSGGTGRDVVGGGQGNDRLFGNGGNDVLKGGLGDDTMTGGAGRDVFTFARSVSGNDTITDFDMKADSLLINLRGGKESIVEVTDDGTDTLVTFGSASVTLSGVVLEESDITFQFI